MDKSLIMSRAAELRNQGYDASSVLSEAWADSGDLELIEAPRHRRSNPTSEAAMNPTMLLLVAAGAYLLWCYYRKTQTGAWSWQPWKAPVVARPMPMSPQRIEALMQRTQAATQQSAPSTKSDLRKTRNVATFEGETIQFIEP